MPLNGRVFKGRVRFTLDASADYSGSGVVDVNGGVSSVGYVAFAPDAIDVAASMALEAGAGLAHSVPTCYGTYVGPGAPFGGYAVSADTMECRIQVVLNVEVWIKLTGGLPEVVCSGGEVDFNGTKVLDVPAFDFVGSGFGPNYVPLCACVGMSAYAGLSFSTPPDVGDSYSYSVHMGHSGGVGYEVQYDGDSGWTAFDIPFIDDAGVVGSDSSLLRMDVHHDNVVDFTAIYGSGGGGPDPDPDPDPDPGPAGDSPPVIGGRLVQTYDYQEGAIEFAPACARPLHVVGEPGDHRATVYRSGFPQTVAFVFHSTTDFDQAHPYPTTVVSTISYPEIHPSLTAFKGSAADGSHAVFSPLGHPAYGLSRLSHDAYSADTTHVDGGTPPDTGHVHYASDSVEFPASRLYNGGVEDADTNPYLVDPNYHVDPRMRYWGSWGNPWWKIGLWFPPAEIFDDGSQAAQAQWPLDGGGVSPQYWKLGRSQWAGEGSLPSAERTSRRTDLIASAVETSGLTGVLDQYWTNGFFRNLGWSRSPVMDCGPGSIGPHEDCPLALDLRDDSATNWVSTDATLSFGVAGVTVTAHDPSQDAATVALLLCEWLAPPFLYPSTCGSITLGFTGADALTASFRSALGGSTLPSPVSDGDLVPIPRGGDSQYAGSWGIEDGVVDPTSLPPETFTTDHGVDQAAGGQSYYVMSDPARAQSFDGATGGQASQLVLTLELSKDSEGNALPATIRYPTFHRAEGEPAVVWESGQCASLLWPDGPGVRWGNFEFWDGLEFNVPPNVLGLGYCSTVVDAIAWRRAVLQGVHSLNGGTTGTGTGIAIPPLTTELAERYVPYEGQAISQADDFSWAFLLPSSGDGHVRVVLGNSFQECPPIAMFPARGRTAGTFAPGGLPTLGVWDQCKEPRDVVAPTNALRVYDPSGAVVSSPRSPSISGWAVERYSPAVTNDEGTDWTLRQGGTTFAKVRPWHGWFWVGGVSSRNGIARLDTPDGTYWRATVEDGALKVRTALVGGPKAGWFSTYSVSTDDTDREPCLTWDPVSSRAFLVWDRDGGIHAAHSDAFGDHWSDPMPDPIIPGGKVPRRRHDDDGDCLYTAIVPDGGIGAGKLVGAWRGRGDLAFSDPFDIVDKDTGAAVRMAGTADAPESYDQSPGRIHDGRWGFALRRPDDSGPVDLFSRDDGRTLEPAN